MIRAIVIDLDDTLLRTSDVYAKAEHQFLDYLTEAGFDPSEAKAVFEKREWENIRKYGYSRQRLPLSMTQTYLHLCKLSGRLASQSRVEAIRRIGESVFSTLPQLVPGASDALACLKRRGLKLILASRGDHDFQKKKVETLNLASFFDAVYITEAEKTEDFYKMVLVEQQIQPEEAVVVGDSIKSDINPALRLGVIGVHIPYRLPHYVWHQDSERPASNHFVVLGSIHDLPTLIERLVSDQAKTKGRIRKG